MMGLSGLLFFVESSFSAVSPGVSRVRGLGDLEKVAFNSEASLRQRWTAVTQSVEMHGDQARPILEKALVSSDWFVRNAALVVLPKMDRTWAVRRSKDLLSDRALVVRTAAVQSLNQLNAIEAESLLWEKLYSSENFRNGKSLWVRRHIVELLARFSSREKKDSFVEILKDEDESLHLPALLALERISGEKKSRRDWLAQ